MGKEENEEKKVRDELSCAGIEELGVIFAILRDVERDLSGDVAGFGNSFGIEEWSVRLRDEKNIDILKRKKTSGRIQMNFEL